jgi:hypothetical protein
MLSFFAVTHACVPSGEITIPDTTFGTPRPPDSSSGPGSNGRLHVRATCKLAASSSQTCPSASGEMNRVTRIRPSCVIPIAAGVGPTATDRVTVRAPGSISTTSPIACSETYASPEGANARPHGCDANGSAMRSTTACAAGSTIAISAVSCSVAHTVPSGAIAMLRGWPSTGISTSGSRPLSSTCVTVTLRLSPLTFQMRSVASSSTSVAECDGWPAGSGRWTFCTPLSTARAPASSRAMTVTV